MERETSPETDGLSRKRKLEGLLENSVPNSQKCPVMESNSSETDDESDSNANEGVSEYEMRIIKAVEKRKMLLKTLGFEQKPLKIDVQQTPTPRRKVQRRSEPLPRREPSRRLRNLEAEKTATREELSAKAAQEPDEPDCDNRVLDTIELGTDILNNLNSDAKFNSGLDLARCSTLEFKSQLLSMNIIKLGKVFMERIQALHVHPSPAKPIIFAGGSRGNLGIWDALKEDANIEVHELHQAPINCISTCLQDQTKVYTTSHDGTVNQIDFSVGKSTNMFATDYFTKISHLTWHHEHEGVLLIGHGSGEVGVLDPRAGKEIQNWIDCFQKSVRTVQHHPVASQYFLASSGTGSFKIFDLRNSSAAVVEQKHDKGLTSAFFSCTGSSIVSTCNDDSLQVFNSQALSGNLAETAHYRHNNHTGRWLTVFKAQWAPGRDDVFHVGSLMSPRKLQFYKADGSGILLELMDELLTVVNSVISMHSSLPFIAGGSSSGKVHLFGPPDD